MPILFPGRLQYISLLVKEQRWERSRMGFCDCLITTHEAANECTHSLREMIIYCLPPMAAKGYSTLPRAPELAVVGLRLTNSVIFWPSTQPKNTIPRWYTGRKWHIPMASNRKRSHGRIKAYEVGQGEGFIVPLQSCTGRE